MYMFLFLNDQTFLMSLEGLTWSILGPDWSVVAELEPTSETEDGAG